MTSVDKIRDAFEERMRSLFYTDASNASIVIIARMLRHDADNNYVDAVTQDYWEEWQVACAWQRNYI
jgi:type IV secretory pathway VirB4 component